MASEEHLALLKQGVDAWNKWRYEHPEIRANLSKADLSGVDLSGADLSRANLNRANLYQANLIQANLYQADLYQADLYQANLYQADLSRATLNRADLSRANLIQANLSRADLSQAHLSQTDLHKANLTNARLGWTHFNDVNLSEVKGLDPVIHRGPFYIDIHTIYKSKGNIPEAFLRGAGVPDNFITYMKSLTGAAFDFYSCFISYSTQDQAFTERLYADLQAKGVRCWYAPHNIQGGKKIHEQVDQAIRLHDKLLLVLSAYSMNSEWVKTEIYKARQRELAEQRRKLFPISLAEYEHVRQWEAFDADIGKDMAREVREYYIPDFTHWKDHDAYQKAFDRLLRDLKAEGQK